ncbi:MAG: hypothetical protein H0X46_09715, partial [Bacteroidetes bacterium]|nr:hypothetical protein [Bacteroidota bacterium]
FVDKAVAQTDTLKIAQTDSLKFIAQADSCITDTVAIAQADTLKWNPDSTWMEWKPEVINIINVETILFGVCVSIKPEADKFPFIPAIFDTVKNWVGIETSDKKKITIKENTVPKKENPQEPVKHKSEEIVAVLPEELKRKSEKYF